MTAEVTGDLEQRLVDVWRRILRVKEIDPTDNIFLDLGADSITAASAIIEIEETVGREISLADLFQNPTIAEQVELLSSDGFSTGCAGDSLRKILGRATTNDLLLFAPSTGHEWIYLHLVRRVADTLGIRVLRDWRLDEGRYVPQTIADLVDGCVDRVLRESEMAPVFAGYSFGGLLAYEVAVRLEQAGRPPAGLVLIDALLRPWMTRTARRWMAKLLWHNAQRNHLWHLPVVGKLLRPDEPAVRVIYALLNRDADYAERPIGPLVDYVLGPDSGIDPQRSLPDAFPDMYELAKQHADPEMVRRFVLPGVNAETLLEHLLVYTSNVLLNNDFVPSAPTNVPILFVTPSQTPAFKEWRAFGRGRFDIELVDGVRSDRYFDAHANMVEPETVPKYSGRLIDWVRERLAEAKR